MHELSIAQSIVDSAREHAALNGGRRVLRIGVRVGEISGVAVEALEFCFGMTVKDTDLDGAALDLERVPVTVPVRLLRARVPSRGVPGRLPCLRARGLGDGGRRRTGALVSRTGVGPWLSASKSARAC